MKLGIEELKLAFDEKYTRQSRVYEQIKWINNEYFINDGDDVYDSAQIPFRDAQYHFRRKDLAKLYDAREDISELAIEKIKLEENR